MQLIPSTMLMKILTIDISMWKVRVSYVKSVTIKLMDNIEILGWVATMIIIGSFLVNDIKILRTLNLLGAFLWSIYGFISMIPSIIFLNIVISGIQVYKLYKLKK